MDSSTGCICFAVQLLIHTGASLDWRLGRGSICYKISIGSAWIYKCEYYVRFQLRSEKNLHQVYIYIYIYIKVEELYCELNYHDQKTWRTPTHDIRKHWTAVSTLLGLINNVYYDLHHWRSNQRPQIAEPKIYNWCTIAMIWLCVKRIYKVHIYIYIYHIEHRNLETRKTLTTSQFKYETFYNLWV